MLTVLTKHFVFKVLKTPPSSSYSVHPTIVTSLNRSMASRHSYVPDAEHLRDWHVT
jgi:hypothetical protein